MNKNLVLSAMITLLVLEISHPTDINCGMIPPEKMLPTWNIKEEMKTHEVNQLHEFIEAIGMLESNNTYRIENRYGMLGKYQFSPLTIEYLGYDVTKEEFLSSPELQDEVMMTYLRANYKTLYDYIMEYDGQEFKGIRLNTASILAGAHFAGAGGLMRFLDNMSDSTGVIDGNGMSLRKYMSRFSEYNITDI